MIDWIQGLFSEPVLFTWVYNADILSWMCTCILIFPDTHLCLCVGQVTLIFNQLLTSEKLITLYILTQHYLIAFRIPYVLLIEDVKALILSKPVIFFWWYVFAYWYFSPWRPAIIDVFPQCVMLRKVWYVTEIKTRYINCV